MPIVEFEASDEITSSLRTSLEVLIPDGSRPRAGHMILAIARFNGLTIHIFADEHPPPHFCVRHNGESASFSITECKRLPGNKGVERIERQIRAWWNNNRDALRDHWNATRPSDCPVGPITS